MILEVGAGGCIIVTPPVKCNRLEKAMSSERIGGVTIRSLQHEKIKGQVIDLGSGCSMFKSENSMSQKKDPITIAFESEVADPYARYTHDIPRRDNNGNIVVKGDDHSYSIVYLFRRGEVVLDSDGNPLRKDAVGYRRHANGQAVIGADGNIARDVNGNVILQYSRGDIMLTESGTPMKDWKDIVPPKVFNDAGAHKHRQFCYSPHLSDICYMGVEDFSRLLDEVQKEAIRRLAGGQPITFDDNPTTVASI